MTEEQLNRLTKLIIKLSIVQFLFGMLAGYALAGLLS